MPFTRPDIVINRVKPSDNEPPVLTVWILYFCPHNVSVGEIQVSLKSDENNVYSAWGQYTFWSISRLFLQ